MKDIILMLIFQKEIIWCLRDSFFLRDKGSKWQVAKGQRFFLETAKV